MAPRRKQNSPQFNSKLSEPVAIIIAAILGGFFLIITTIIEVNREPSSVSRTSVPLLSETSTNVLTAYPTISKVVVPPTVTVVINETATLPVISPTETIITRSTDAETVITSDGNSMSTPATSDGMQMVYVPAGEFLMGSTTDQLEAFLQECPQCDYSNESPQHRVFLNEYWIDKTEVTKAMFARFLNEKGNQTEGGVPWMSDIDIIQVSSLWQPKEGSENHPMTFVSWFGANAYCQWAGRQLPSEAQWEKAARGTDGQMYPWGNSYDCKMGNFDDGGNCDGYLLTAPVGSYPDNASPYGALDMVGNVWEFVADFYDTKYFSNSVYEDPPGPPNGIDRVMKGGSYVYHPLYQRSPARWPLAPDRRSRNVGFRCSLLP